MAEDIARLGIVVDSDGVLKADKRLNKLDKQSIRNERTNKKLTKSFGALKTAVAVVGFGALLKGAISTAAAFEKMNASLITITGSSEKATMAMDGIIDFATSTPFQVEEITQAFIKLKALGLEPSEAALKSFGNTASAMGKSLDQLIEAVADAATGEFERLKEFGIKSRSEGENVKFTFQGITTTVGKNAKEITEFLKKIGDVQFAGAMSRQMDTLDGKFSNLSDSIDIATKKLSEESGFNALIKTATDGLALFIREAAGTQSISDFKDKIGAAEEQIKTFQAVIEKQKQQKEGFLNYIMGTSPSAIIDITERRIDALRGKVLGFQAEISVLNEKSKGLDIAAGVDVESDNQEKLDILQAQLDEENNLKRLAYSLNLLDQMKAHEDELALDKATADAKLSISASMFANLSSLMSSKSKGLFAIGKAAAISGALIKGYSAVLNSYEKGTAIGGPILGAAFAATAGIATAVQIDRIQGSQFQGQAHDGLDYVPKTGSYVLEKGEAVIDKGTSEKMRQGANGGSGVVNYITLQAIDTQSGIDFLQKNGTVIFNENANQMNENGLQFA